MAEKRSWVQINVWKEVNDEVEALKSEMGVGSKSAVIRTLIEDYKNNSFNRTKAVRVRS